jgi:hypothetical protein
MGRYARWPSRSTTSSSMFAEYASLAAERGVTLIPGIERTIRASTYLLNFSGAAEDVRASGDLAVLKRREAGLVIAPHPFFPGFTCLRGLLDRHADLFDAVEYNAMFTPTRDFSHAIRKERWARRDRQADDRQW